MTFEIGQTYEMKTRGIDRDSNGYDYIALVSDDKGDEKKDFRVYNFMKGFYKELPHTISVIVNYIDAFGKVKFRQNEPQILQEHYEKDKMYSFHIIGTDTDGNEKSYYHIEDDFAKQRYYYVGDAIHNIGDDVVLKVCGTVESSGYLYFEEVQPANIVSSTPIVKVKRTNGNGKYYVNYGPESKTLEYKTSIAFPPGNNGVADIDKQMSNIVRALTAMMNAEGGKLVIGVHDKTQEITGVADDFPHLNDGYVDKYAGQYPLNDDGYKRKILNSVRYLSGTYAGSLLDVKPAKKGGLLYYVVEIMKADRPIWMRTPEQGTILFQRHDGSNQQLWGDELTQFIVRRMQKSIYERDNNPNLTKDLESIMEKALTDIINKRHSTNVVIPPLPPRTVDYWVVWNDKGEWRRQRAKATSCYVQLPVYKNMSNPVLLLCYKNTKRVAAMNWTETRKGINLDQPQPSLWNTGAREIPEMFIVESRDYLAIHSIDHNGTECMKLLAIGDFNTVKKRGAVGVPILLDNANAISFKVIDAQYYPSVKDLLVTKSKRVRELGTPINTASAQLTKQINYLMSIPAPQVP